MRPARKVCTQLDLTFKPGGTRSLKVEERHPTVNTAGLSGSRWIYRRTHAPVVCRVWFMFLVRTLLLCAIVLVGIFTCPPLCPPITLWRRWFTLGLHVLSHFWIKSNGSPTMVLDTWLIKPCCGRRDVLEGALSTPWKKIEWNWDTKKDQRWIVNLWRTCTIFVALNATKPATTDEDMKRTYVLRIWCPSLI
jgi:hypothetical protein